MNRLRKFFKAIRLIIRNPWLLKNVLNDEQVWKNYVIKTYHLQNGLPVIDINKLIPNSTEVIKPFAFLDGSSLPTDIALLKTLAKNINNCKYFEIGTWRGESVANVAQVAKECYTLNLSEAEMRNSGKPEDYINIHGFFSKHLSNVTHLKGNSKTFDYSQLNKKFDLIFIDGDHHYEFVKNDTQKAFESLIHDNSIIVWHDYGHNPEKIRWEVLAGILDEVPKEKHKNIYHVSNTMCALFINKKIEGKPLHFPTKPDKVFEVSIKSNKLNEIEL